MPLKFERSFLSKGFVVFVLISFAMMLGIMLWTTEKDTWDQLSTFRIQFIPLLIFLGIIRWYFDGMAFVTMAKHGSKSSISLARATIIRLESTVVAIVVPMLVGVVSMHTYLLHKQKLRISESVAITVLRATLPIFLFLFNIPILFFLKNNPEGNVFFTKFIQVISLPILVAIVFFIIALFYPETFKKMASSLVRFWGKRSKKHVDRIVALEKKLEHEIDQFSTVFWSYLKSKKLMMIKAAFWIFLAFFIDYIIALGILWGFGYEPPLLRSIGIQFLMRPIIFFAFTPGGTGIWDFTYLGFFKLYMPHYLIGISVLLWRLIINYLPCVVGAFYLAKEFKGKKDLENVLKKESQLIDEIDPEKSFEDEA